MWYIFRLIGSFFVFTVKSRKIVFLGAKNILINFRLRKMKAEFLNMPELAQCCSLADIVPPFQV